MDALLGRSYARSWAYDVVLPPLGCTVMQALDRGEDTKDVWRAVCATVDVPATLR